MGSIKHISSTTIVVSTPNSSRWLKNVKWSLYLVLLIGLYTTFFEFMAIHSTVLTTLITFSCAQVFPFSNLRAFFDLKKQAKDNVGVSSSNVDVNRPHRQAELDHEPLPDLSEFDSPDIFTINREMEDHRPVKRRPSDSERKGNGRHRTNTPARNPDESIFITPRPANHNMEYTDSKRSKNRARIRKPQVQAEPDVEPSQYDKRLSDFPFGNPAQSSSEETRYENVPPPPVTIKDVQPQKDNDDLVDYLVPPEHPSVYEKALKLGKRNPHRPGMTKMKSPPPNSISKKEGRYRPKKRREPSGPMPDSATKRHVPRRRPAHPPRKPYRTPTPEAAAAAAQMDEQITSETGFTGVHGAHGNERVEFQMHGQKGPNSYKFGYDTGKGHNRQFRFEEKDNHGRVKGHYGYYDKEGKLQIVNYEADPHTGFTAKTV